MKTPIINLREEVIKKILDIVDHISPNNYEMLLGFACLLNHLKQAEPNETFLLDLKGFMFWAQMNGKVSLRTLADIFHDLREFENNRNEKWFCPRTSGYAKFLNENENPKAK